MIIKSHIRGGFRSAAQYMKEQGKNEKTRLVELSDPSAKKLDDAFQNMWSIASNTKCTKPLHHISINPVKGETLTDKQLLAIVERCEEKYGYQQFRHQRVIVEHVKDGRQHFHVIWNRISLTTGRAVWPGEHWNKSKQVCREMEKELGLIRPVPRQRREVSVKAHRRAKPAGRFIRRTGPIMPKIQISQVWIPMFPLSARRTEKFLPMRLPRKHSHVPAGKHKTENKKMPIRPAQMSLDEIIAWAFANGRLDILAQYGIHLPADYFEL